MLARLFAFGMLLLAVLWTVAQAEETKTDAAKLPPAADKKVDFVTDIQPLLADRCYKCHGPEKHESGLRLNAKDDAMSGGDSGPAITPGKSADSKLIHYVAGMDPDAVMPPDGEGTRLTPQEVGLFRAWIDQGAIWPLSADSKEAAPHSEHWSYKKPILPPVPQIAHLAAARNAIDHFILQRLESEGIEPSPPADRARLIRRVTLDLTGLPPTPEEVAAFVSDTSGNAYEKVVDRLLASPRFGERWASMWLDMARYADTDGYEGDMPRSIWPYRDWVVKAFNDDMPFDEFTIKQLAGDLLPKATLADRVATGFNRNTMTNHEGGTDEEEFRSAAVIDRVNTTSTVWLGATMACCQCHSHKYDPYKHKEYYQLLAIFNTTADPGRTHGPEIGIPPENLEAIKESIAATEARLSADTPELLASQEAWEKSVTEESTQWSPLEVTDFSSDEGATWAKQKDGSVLVNGRSPAKDEYVVTVTTTLDKVRAIRLEVLPDPKLPSHGPGRSAKGNFVLSKLYLESLKDGKEPILQTLGRPTADYSQPNFPAASTVAAQLGPGWAIYPEVGKPHDLIAEIIHSTPTEKSFHVGMKFNFGDRNTLGRFRLWATDSDAPKVGRLPVEISRVIAIPPDQRSAENKQSLKKYYREIAPELKRDRDHLASLVKRSKPIATTLVMQELPVPRKTRVFVRGNFLTLGEPVEAGVPAIFPPTPKDEPVTRLTFARWLVNKENPLTARVTVNHFWEQLFGQGIVVTTEDFGTKGDRPSHPELLDWLAVDFMESGWGMKGLIRQMVTSATYQQSSKATPQSLDRDPANQLLSRGPRRRLDAESIRDQTLAISGLLCGNIGGPPVRPPVPAGAIVTFGNDPWIDSTGEDRYRRSLYTTLRRTTPFPTFMSFDAPSREFCVARRSTSNTPIQALNTLNDPVFMEAAVGLAKRMIAEGGAMPTDRATRGFKLCLARDPQPQEIAKLVSLYKQELERYQSDVNAAKKLITEGAKAALPEKIDVSELAAWTVVANVLLNLDETITK